MIGFFEYQYLKFKKNHLQNLVALARADGYFHEDEKKFLFNIGLKYKLKPQQVQRIIDSKETAEPIIPDSSDKKIALLYDTVGMMLADGVIDDREMEFCRDIFNRFGFEEPLIELMVKTWGTDGAQDPDQWEVFVDQAMKYAIQEQH